MDCPICSLTLRDPYLTSCCGTNFCHTCSKRLQAEHKPCPTCRKNKFELFPNKSLGRTVRQLHVLCTDGCDWTGELGQLENHLDKVVHCGEYSSRWEAFWPECWYATCIKGKGCHKLGSHSWWPVYQLQSVLKPMSVYQFCALVYYVYVYTPRLVPVSSWFILPSDLKYIVFHDLLHLHCWQKYSEWGQFLFKCLS